MSKVISNEQPEFDFWEFVACARCHLPFSADSGAQPPVPFWVTECGHVLCNNHLSNATSISIPSFYDDNVTPFRT